MPRARTQISQKEITDYVASVLSYATVSRQIAKEYSLYGEKVDIANPVVGPVTLYSLEQAAIRHFYAVAVDRGQLEPPGTGAAVQFERYSHRLAVCVMRAIADLGASYIKAVAGAEPVFYQRNRYDGSLYRGIIKSYVTQGESRVGYAMVYRPQRYACAVAARNYLEEFPDLALEAVPYDVSHVYMYGNAKSTVLRHAQHLRADLLAMHKMAADAGVTYDDAQLEDRLQIVRDVVNFRNDYVFSYYVDRLVQCVSDMSVIPETGAAELMPEPEPVSVGGGSASKWSFLIIDKEGGNG